VTKGFYGGGTFGWPTPIGGVGAGLYFDNHQNFYPQIYYGTPKLGISAGYSPDLENFLTGTSVAGNFGTGRVQYNIGASGGSAGIGAGTPGFGATYGFGPYRFPTATPDAAGEVNPAIYSTGFALPPPSEQDSFDSRFGDWSPVSTSDPRNASSPVLRELLKYRGGGVPNGSAPRSAQALPPTPIAAQPGNSPRLDGDQPERYLGRRVVNPSAAASRNSNASAAPDSEASFNDRFGDWRSSSAGSAPGNVGQQGATPEAATPPGFFTGKPMPPVPIWDLFDPSPATSNNTKDWLSRWIGPRS
jgi:hypothetical protein